MNQQNTFQIRKLHDSLVTKLVLLLINSSKIACFVGNTPINKSPLVAALSTAYLWEVFNTSKGRLYKMELITSKVVKLNKVVM